MRKRRAYCESGIEDLYRGNHPFHARQRISRRHRYSRIFRANGFSRGGRGQRRYYIENRYPATVAHIRQSARAGNRQTDHHYHTQRVWNPIRIAPLPPAKKILRPWGHRVCLDIYRRNARRAALQRTGVSASRHTHGIVCN